MRCQAACTHIDIGFPSTLDAWFLASAYAQHQDYPPRDVVPLAKEVQVEGSGEN